MVKFVVIFIVLISLLTINARIQIISSDGILMQPGGVNKLIKEIVSDEDIPIMNVVDCTENSNGHIICNNLFSTKFENSQAGIYLDYASDIFVNFCVFNSMYDLKLCGMKVADFAKCVSDKNCLLLSDLDLESSLVAYDQLIRRLLFEKTSTLHIIIVPSNQLHEEDKSRIKRLVQEYCTNSDIIGLSEAHLLNIQFASQAKELLDSIDYQSSFRKSNKLSLFERYSTTWRKLNSKPIQKLLTKTEKMDLSIVDAACTSGLIYSEGIISEWRKRVSSGRLISNFRKRVDELISSVLVKFNQRTGSVSVSRERAERAKLLLDQIQRLVTSLFSQQLAILHFDVQKSFKRNLLQQLAVNDNLPKVAKEQLIRESLHEFNSICDEIQVPQFELAPNNVANDLIITLENICQELPETATAKLAELRKYEKRSMKSKKKNGRAINFSLGIVGMLRPSGYGNLQGYFNCVTSMSGIPLEILFGFHNDGDSPDVLGADRELPILRLQPKVNFDIDL